MKRKTIMSLLLAVTFLFSFNSNVFALNSGCDISGWRSQCTTSYVGANPSGNFIDLYVHNKNSWDFTIEITDVNNGQTIFRKKYTDAGVFSQRLFNVYSTYRLKMWCSDSYPNCEAYASIDNDW